MGSLLLPPSLSEAGGVGVLAETGSRRKRGCGSVGWGYPTNSGGKPAYVAGCRGDIQ